MKHVPHFVVGFCGKSESGKTTLAKAVRERFQLRYKRFRPVGMIKFARPIREMLRVVGVEKGDESGETPHPLFRPAAQLIGDWFREQDEAFWVNLWRKEVAGLSAPTLLLNDDLRYVNEGEACDLSVKLVTTRTNKLTPAQMLHRSETEWELVRHDMLLCTDDPKDINGYADRIEAEIVERMKR